MSHLVDILSLIDAGLGVSAENGMTHDSRNLCWRCQDRRATPRMDGCCEACTAWLLGEGDDPIRSYPMRLPNPPNWVDLLPDL